MANLRTQGPAISEDQPLQECTEWDNVRMLDEQFVECEFQAANVSSRRQVLGERRKASGFEVITQIQFPCF